MPSVQIGYAGQETVGTVGFFIAPVVRVTTLGNVVDGVKGLTCQTTENGEIFFAREDAPLSCRCTSKSTDGVTCVAVVGIRVADDVTLSVDGAVSGFHHNFRTSVAIEVKDHKLGVVGSCTDIGTKVNAPKTFTIEAVAVEERIARVAVVSIVVGIGGVPFEDDFVLAVAIHITYRGIVGRVVVAVASGGDATLGFGEGDVDIADRSIGRKDVCA